MNTIIPFYQNTQDNTHCFQACFKMLAKYFWPSGDYSWKKLDIYTAKAKDLWTWPMAGVLWVQKQGVEVVDIEIFDYKQFVEKKEQYLLSFYGQEAGTEQIKFSNIEQELIYAKEFEENIAIQNRIPTVGDVIRLLDSGYLLICCINQMALNEKKSYVGHFVVITGHDENGLYFHDPGLPAYENRMATYELFEKAWANPTEKVKNILAFRLQSNKD